MKRSLGMPLRHGPLGTIRHGLVHPLWLIVCRPNILRHMASDNPPVEVIRSRSHQVFCLIAAAFCLGLGVAGIVFAFGRSNPAPQFAISLVMVVLGAAAIRWSLSSVIVDYSQDALIVRNPLRTYRVAWSDLEGFALVDSPLNGRSNRQLVKVVRKDGSRTTCVGACAPGFDYALRMEGQLNEANARRTRYLFRAGKEQHPKRIQRNP